MSDFCKLMVALFTDLVHVWYIGIGSNEHDFEAEDISFLSYVSLMILKLVMWPLVVHIDCGNLKSEIPFQCA